MPTRRQFLRRASGLLVPLGFPAIVRAQNFSSVAKVTSWTRPSGTGEPASPLTAPNIWAFYRSDMGLTDSGSPNYYVQTANCWLDQSPGVRHWQNVSGTKCQRILSDVNGKDSVKMISDVTSAVSTLNHTAGLGQTQPCSFYALVKANNWTSGCYLLSSMQGANHGGLAQFISDPIMEVFVGGGSVIQVTPPATGTWYVLSCCWNNATSWIEVNNNGRVNGTVGSAANPDYWLFGNATVGTAANNGRFSVAAMAFTAANDSTGTSTIIKNWMAWYGGLTI